MNRTFHPVVLIGSPRSGKSTLMAAWYHFADRAGYDLTPIEGDADAVKVVELAADLREARKLAVDSSEPGIITRARFRCSRKINQDKHAVSFDLVLCDYSGEDVRDAFDRVRLAGTAVDDEPIVNEVVNEAERIIFVIKPQWLVSGDPTRQHEIMLLLKHLKVIKDSRQPHLFERCRFYFSHADATDDQVRADAERMVREMLDKQGINPITVIHGASVIKDKNGRVRFPDDGKGQPQTLINQTMIDFMPGKTGAGLGRWSRGTSKAKAAVIVLVLFAIVAATPVLHGWWFDTEGACGVEWRAHLEVLNSLERQAGGNLSYAQARGMMDDLDAWVATAEARFADCLAAANVGPRLASVRDDLEKVEAPQGTDAVVRQIRSLRQRYGSDLQAFYEQLRKTARNERANLTYTREARDEWKRIETYSDRILGGIDIRFGVSWLDTPYFWIPGTGSGQLRAELWVTSRADPKPFDASTEVSPQADVLWTDEVDYTGPNDERYHYRWTKFGGTSRPIQIGDRLWVRFWHDRAYFKVAEELAHIEVPLGGPDLLGWFNRRQVISIGSQEAACLIRVNVDPPLEVPSALRQGF